MFGDIAAWFYKALAGIRIGAPGFEHIVIAPNPVEDLTFAKATVDTVRGPVSSDWKIENGTFKLDVSIPANTTATVILPAERGATITESGKPITEAAGVTPKQWDEAGAVLEVGSGNYSFSVTKS